MDDLEHGADRLVTRRCWGWRFDGGRFGSLGLRWIELVEAMLRLVVLTLRAADVLGERGADDFADVSVSLGCVFDWTYSSSAR